MKTLISILVLFSSSVFSNEIIGLFGIKLGETFSEELRTKVSLTDDDLFNLKDITTITEIKELDKLRNELFSVNNYLKSITSEVKPRLLNNSFNQYSVSLSPLDKKILSISAKGKNKKECKNVITFYKDYFFNKYKDYYPNLYISNIVDSTLNIYFSKSELDIVGDYIHVNFSCQKFNLRIKATNKVLTQRIKREEGYIIEKAIVKKINKLLNNDTSGL